MVNNNKVNTLTNVIKGLVQDKESTNNKTSSWNSTTNNIRYPTEKLVKDSLDNKANSNHTHTKSEITDFPSIPSKTSDLVNDGDGSNVFVKDNDSRLSNARTPLAHTHLSSDVTDLIDVIYPIGSIYMSVNSVNPSTLFGGTWEQIKDTFLLSSGDTYNNGATGGATTVSLTQSQMPRHTHTQNGHTHGMAHTHNHHHKMFDGNAWSNGSGSTSAYAKTSNRSGFQGYTTYDNTASSKSDTDSTTATNQYTGGTDTTQAEQNGSAHENMPPYIVVNVWKRTA